MWEIILALVGLALGLGLRWFKFVPKIAMTILGIGATVVLTVMLWNFAGLPAVELLNSFANNMWVLGLALGYLVGDRVGDFF